MLPAVMLLGLYMNAAIGSTFDETAWVFVTLYLVMSTRRDVWVSTVSPRMFLRDHYQRMIVWAVVAGMPWLAGAADHERRLAWWAPAAAIDLVGVVAAHQL